ncbi:DedA family protein [Pseudoclavibacter sp. 13-3]|uniref:DedA family protein n=1 Tax=Pseudoclavibacter sp. 13-3 TaxID=2901228 RepID=UPI001E43E743|nr:DedA family protein [Pseudoclavibacter sp. 13-3]MCD7100650.1 DedA family protein [Pseudoclavibacter sp. 13-3]
MTEMFDAIDATLLTMSASPWVLVILFLFIAIDAFFPPVPSETLVVALAALAVAQGEPQLWLLLIVSAVAAAAGDNVAFWFGSRLHLDQRVWAARPRMQRLIQTARHTLHRRPAMLLLTARYIPVGRVVVNMTAGATGFPWRRFLPLSLLAGASWSVYSVLIGLLAGAWAKQSPFLAAVLAIAIALSLGVIIDWSVKRWQRHRRRVLRARVREDAVCERANAVRSTATAPATSHESSLHD